jgi:hypothetical protein
MAAAATSTAMKLPFGTPKVDDGIWIVSFMHNDLGFIDVEQKALQPLRHRVVTDISGTFRYLCLAKIKSSTRGR